MLYEIYLITDRVCVCCWGITDERHIMGMLVDVYLIKLISCVSLGL